MHTVPLLRTALEVEAWLADTRHGPLENAAVYDRALQRLGKTEAERLWHKAHAIAAVRVLRTVNQARWCKECARRLCLLPDGRLPTHTHGYDRICPGETGITWNPGAA